MREFEEKHSNIESFVDKNIVVKNVNIDEGDGINVTTLTLESGELVTTTSEVIRKQALEELRKGVPFSVRIVKAGNGPNKYYKFGVPNQQ